MKPQPLPGDDPAFVSFVSRIADSLVLRHQPDLVALIEIDNWFDHKWLNFSGKVLGALGVWQKDLTIPPFHPNRIKVHTAYRLNKKGEYEQFEARPLHIFQSSSENLRRKLKHAPAASRVFIWWSGKTEANVKGSLMAYIHNATDAISWYVSFDCGDRWKVNKTKNISVQAVMDLLRSAEPTAPPNGGPAQRLGTSGVGGGPPSVS
jgi:hypothetical protein